MARNGCIEAHRGVRRSAVYYVFSCVPLTKAGALHEQWESGLFWTFVRVHCRSYLGSRMADKGDCPADHDSAHTVLRSGILRTTMKCIGSVERVLGF